VPPVPAGASPGRAARGRFKLVPPTTSEDELHESVAQLLKFGVLPPAMWTCFPAGNVPLEPRFAAKLYRMGLSRGWPDFLLVSGGHAHGLELKRRDGKLSRSRFVRTKQGRPRWVEGQEDVLPKLQDAGMKIAVCETLDEVIDALVFWRIPLRGGISR
jgi:hypothetical protein